MAAPSFVLSILVLAAVGAVWRGAWAVLLGELFVYLLVGFAAGLQVMKKSKATLRIALIMPALFATIHLSWGFSFLLRLLAPKRRKV